MAHQVFLWIVQGATDTQICEAVARDFPGHDAEPLILQAVAKLIESAELDPQIVAGWCFEAYRDLYRRMVEIGDFAGALRAVKSISELGG